MWWRKLRGKDEIAYARSVVVANEKNQRALGELEPQMTQIIHRLEQRRKENHFGVQLMTAMGRRK